MAETTVEALVDGKPEAVEDVKQQMEAVQISDKDEDGDGQPGEGGKSKKALKKEARKAQKQAQQASAAAARPVVEDPLKDKYGDMPLIQSQNHTKRHWIELADLTEKHNGQQVWVQGQVHVTRPQGNNTFVVLREGTATIQVVVSKTEGKVSKQMVKFVADVPRESWVEVLGTAKIPLDKDGNPEIIKGTSQEVEIAAEAFRVMSRAEIFPLDVLDAARSEEEIEAKQLPAVKQDTRLDNRYLDLRTPANQAIFALQAAVCQLFREYLMKNKFMEIHTPKLIAGSSEGGANVFTLKYFGRDACLGQSPQLFKQMAIMSGFKRVFEIGPVFRAENSNTHRHLCEFTGLDFEMAIHEHYSEVMDVIEGIFFYMFEHLQQDYSKQIEAVSQQYPVSKLQWSPTRISFQEGIQLLRDDGYQVGELDDLNTEAERRLGTLVKAKYNTDFFIMYRYPLQIRPFYTMPDAADPLYSNSFDVFIRGEEIISGAQRVHDPNLLLKMAERCGVSMAQEGVKDYVNSFKYGARPHGGAGVGLERVVMLFLGLDNIRKTSMFPRDPRRITP